MQVLTTDPHGITSLKHPIKMWTDGVPVEDAALEQLMKLSSLPFIHRHLAVMPDVHHGKGSTVGTVIATAGAIVPAAVGVDIGCGMNAVKTNLRASELPDNLFGVRSAIEEVIPHGRSDNGGMADVGARKVLSQNLINSFMDELWDTYKIITDKHAVLADKNNRMLRQLGTLGTGNHFIELCVDENQDVWVMLHSGSRGIGNSIGQFFIERAKRHMEDYFITLPDRDLAYLPQQTNDFDDYMRAVNWAQRYALLNRRIMMADTLQALSHSLDRDVFGGVEAVNCHHNYVATEKHFGKNVFVTRKGAVSAQKDELGVIPGSMGAKSFIVRGKGNREAFCSCSHGAGRAMSREAARRIFTLDDHRKATEGVECRKDDDVIDETPGAYKRIEAVMAAQSDLVEIVHTLKQIVCVKG